MNLIPILISVLLNLIAGLALFPFNKEHKKRRVVAIVIICSAISVLLVLTLNHFQNQKNLETEIVKANERAAKDSLEMLRYQNSISLIDSITKTLNLAYTKMNNQEKINQILHDENMTKLFGIAQNLEGIINDVNTQSKNEKEYFTKSLDSLSKLTDHIFDVSKKVDMENYPLVPINIYTTLHVKYKNSPFDSLINFYSYWDYVYKYDEQGNPIGTGVRKKSHDGDGEWFTFYNKENKIVYGNYLFPKFVDEEKVMNYLRQFKLTFEIKKDSIIKLIYPKLAGMPTEYHDGKIVTVINLYDDYKIEIYHLDDEHEFVFYINYFITRFNSWENIGKFKSLNDFKNLEMKVKYELVNPFRYGVQIERYKSVEKTKTTEHETKDTIYSSTITTIDGGNITEPFKLDIDSIYLDSELKIEYGKNFTQIKVINIIPNCAKFSFDTYYSWLQSEGRYLFK